jgi:LacI family transcriptional regulator
VNRPPRIALLIETSSSFGRGLLAGIARYARLHGPWSLFVEPGGLDVSTARLKGWGVSGILALVRTRPQAERIRAAGVPAVDLDCTLPGLLPWGPSADERAVAGAAAEHLLGRGLRRFAFCGWDAPGRGAVWEAERGKYFGDAVRRAGFPVETYAPPGRTSRRPWARELGHLRRWLAGLGRPAGVLASNDQRGRHVLEAARLAGLRVPEDLAVLGVDDDEVLCEMSVPSLSSVALNTRRVGFEAAAMLDRLMRGKEVPRRPVRVPPLGVVARRSTDVVAVEDEVVCAAVRFLRENAHRPIRIADVVRAVPVSRKTLEVRFARALGRTPHEELARVRLERAQDLLARTDWPLNKVAAAAGFTYVEHFHGFFRRHACTTPARYRHSMK